MDRKRKPKGLVKLQLDKNNSFLSQLKSYGPHFVLFYSDVNCPACKRAKGYIENIKIKTTIEFYGIEINDKPKITRQYLISGIPTLILFSGRNVTDTRFSGIFDSYEKFCEKIGEMLGVKNIENWK